MSTIKPYTIQNQNTNVSRKQSEYDIGYKAVQGDKEQQDRATNLINELKTILGGNVPNAYIKLATILSKDKNATVDDILNTYSQLSLKEDANGSFEILGPNAIEEILNDFIREIGSSRARAVDYLNSDYISVSSIQYALEQLRLGNEYHIPTAPKNTPPQTTIVESPKTAKITPDSVLNYMEQDSKLRKINFINKINE